MANYQIFTDSTGALTPALIEKAGLQVLQNPDRPGLMALIESAGLGDKPLTAENISYALAPRINAAGRMGSPARALQQLLCEDWEQAQVLAEDLNHCNQERQAAEQKILEEVQARLAADPSLLRDPVLLLWGEDYHPGVIGIVASRLVEKYGRPAILVSIQNGEGRGSGRSVAGFNLHAAISACGDLLIRYGGHALAAGLSVEPARLPELRRRLNDWARARCPAPPAPTLALDLAVRLDEITVEDVESLSWLAPCGAGNPAPLFLVRDAQVEAVYPVGDGRHSRLRLRQGTGTLYAVYFGYSPAQLPCRAGERVDVALSLSVYDGKNGPQLSGRIRELRPAGLDGAFVEQASWFEALQGGAPLTGQQKAVLRPERADTVTVYRMVQSGAVSADDSLGLFAAVGGGKAGKALVSLEALRQLGLVEARTLPDGRRRWAPVPAAQKQDLASAPILRQLEE